MNDLYTAVVHDIKNQLAELALRLNKRGDAPEEMKIAMNAARRLSEMLMVHRQATDLLRINVVTINPADFLGILAAEYRELFPEISISVDVEHAPDCAFFDDALVRMAVGNALHNACRHAHKNIRLSAFEEDGMLVFEILDDGPGYPESILALGGEAPAAASNSGTGLGLYLARKIADLHQLNGRHGSVELGNTPGGRFRMKLP